MARTESRGGPAARAARRRRAKQKKDRGNLFRPFLRPFGGEILFLRHQRHGEECDCATCSSGATWRYGRRILGGGHVDALNSLVRFAEKIVSPKDGSTYVVVEVYLAKLRAACGLAVSTLQQYFADWSKVLMPDGAPLMWRARRRCQEYKNGRSPHPKTAFRAILHPQVVGFARDPHAARPLAPPIASGLAKLGDVISTAQGGRRETLAERVTRQRAERARMEDAQRAKLQRQFEEIERRRSRDFQAELAASIAKLETLNPVLVPSPRPSP